MEPYGYDTSFYVYEIYTPTTEGLILYKSIETDTKVYNVPTCTMIM